MFPDLLYYIGSFIGEFSGSIDIQGAQVLHEDPLTGVGGVRRARPVGGFDEEALEVEVGDDGDGSRVDALLAVVGPDPRGEVLAGPVPGLRLEEAGAAVEIK